MSARGFSEWLGAKRSEPQRPRSRWDRILAANDDSTRSDLWLSLAFYLGVLVLLVLSVINDDSWFRVVFAGGAVIFLLTVVDLVRRLLRAS